MTGQNRLVGPALGVVLLLLLLAGCAKQRVPMPSGPAGGGVGAGASASGVDKGAGEVVGTAPDSGATAGGSSLYGDAGTGKGAGSTGWGAGQTGGGAGLGGGSSDAGQGATSSAAVTGIGAAGGTGVAGAGVGGAAVGSGLSNGTQRPSPAEFATAAELHDIHFDFDRYDIRPDEAERLNANAEWLRSRPEALVLIEGHCDETGTEIYNMALGEHRAESARNYLVSQGVPPARIAIISYGELRPVCDDPSEACLARNRRARFLVRSQ
jgi:peptidoglycan-associated lipoprotein